MGRQRYRISRIKVHRSYTVEDIAELLGITSQTVRHWIKQGLPAITDERPYLILGWQLKAWLKARGTDRARPLKNSEFYCLRCKVPRKPAMGLTEHAVSSDGWPMLRGFCEVCETLCHRFLPPA